MRTPLTSRLLASLVFALFCAPLSAQDDALIVY